MMVSIIKSKIWRDTLVIVINNNFRMSPETSTCTTKHCFVKGGPGSLDNMLGNLNADMTKQGIMTVPKGSCAACQKPIVGLVSSK